MILREATIKYSNTDPDKLSKGSHVRVCVSCNGCGRIRWVVFKQVKNLCLSCSQKLRNQLPKPKFIKEENRFISGTGIDRILTIEKFNYDPINLSRGSNKEIVVICKDCGEIRIINFNQYKLLCRKCSHNTDEYKNNVSGDKHHQFGIPRSNEVKEKISKGNMNHVCPDHVKKILHDTKLGENNPQYGLTGEKAAAYGLKHSLDDRIKNSCRQRGINVEDFDGFVGRHPERDYAIIEEKCIKMNDRFKGSHFHHITKSLGIYIPSELHRHIGHNMKTGKNMGEINALAIQYLNGGLEI